MPQTDKYMKRRRQKYLCSNPNCRRVFSRPKIIRYYVCPTCQTLVDMTRTEDKKEAEVTSAAPELVIRRMPKIIEPEKSQELEAINMRATSAQPTGEERRAPTEEEPKASEKTIVLEQVHVSQPQNVELTPTQERTVETKTVSPSSSGCNYSFGYLSQREKGEGIPETCIECAKLLDCMFLRYYKSGESVVEIKKWYKF